METVLAYRLGHQTERLKKLIKICRGLRWPPINKTMHNNQPKTGSRNERAYEEDSRQARGVGKHEIIVFGGDKVKVKGEIKTKIYSLSLGKSNQQWSATPLPRGEPSSS
jgi:hypothetical protein